MSDDFLKRVESILGRRNYPDPDRHIEVVSDDGRWRIVDVFMGDGRRYRVHTERPVRGRYHASRPGQSWIEYRDPDDW